MAGEQIFARARRGGDGTDPAEPTIAAHQVDRNPSGRPTALHWVKGKGNMESPRTFAKAVARSLVSNGSAPAAPAQPASPWVKWSEAIVADLAENHEAFVAISQIFEDQEQRMAALERRIAELEKKPAARTVEHIRDSAGLVTRSISLETP
jgi:hypothetical protein